MEGCLEEHRESNKQEVNEDLEMHKKVTKNKTVKWEKKHCKSTQRECKKPVLAFIICLLFPFMTPNATHRSHYHIRDKGC